MFVWGDWGLEFLSFQRSIAIAELVRKADGAICGAAEPRSRSGAPRTRRAPLRVPCGWQEALARTRKMDGSRVDARLACC